MFWISNTALSIRACIAWNAGMDQGEMEDSELGRKAKVYRMTALGRRELGSQLSGWTVFTEAVDRVTRSPASAE